jgi:PST family polysaccharide transporter
LSTPPTNIGERLKTGARWSGAEILLNLPVRLGTLAILARLLLPTEFGVFAAAVTVIEFVRPISTLSMDHALVQSKKLRPDSAALAFVFAIAVSSVAATVVALNADKVLLLYDDRDVPPLVVALALSIPLGAASSLFLAVLQRKLVFRELSIIAMLCSALAALGSVTVAALGAGVWALVAGYYLDLVLRILLAWSLVRPRLVRPRIGNEARRLLRFGMGTTLSLTLNFWALHGDYVAIGSVLGPKPLGYYSRAYQLISTIPGMLGNLQSMVLFPTFSRAQGDRSSLAKALRIGTEATAALTLPFCAWGLVLGPEVIFVLLGPGWEGTVVPFQILSLGVYFRAAYRFAASIVMATGHVFAMSACQAIYATLVVVGAFVGTRWGIAGVAAATLLALFIFYLLLHGLAARVSGVPVRSFVLGLARPSLIFLVVAATAALIRTSLLHLGWPPIVILIVAVTLGILTLIGATRVLKNRLWGDFLYQRGMMAIRPYLPPTKKSQRESDTHGD